MKKLFVLLIFISSAALANDSLCREKMYTYALRDTGLYDNYFVCFQVKTQNGDIVKGIAENHVLWWFFRDSLKFSYKQYNEFMMDIFRNKKVLDANALKGEIPYIQCEFKDETRKLLKNKKGKESILDYFYQRNKYAYRHRSTTETIPTDIDAHPDWHYLLWEWGISTTRGGINNAKTYIGFDCKEE
jgi:hypothetical protein